MEQITCNIIMCCKGHGEGKDPRDKIFNYLSKECAVERKYYCERDLTSVLHSATLDYLTDGNGKEFMHYFFDSHFTDRNDAIMSALGLVQVKHSIGSMIDKYTMRENNEYINGFTETLCKQSLVDLEG